MSAEVALAELEAKVLKLKGVGTWLESVDGLKLLLAVESTDIRRRVLAMVLPKIEQQALEAVLTAFGLGVSDARAITGRRPKGLPKKPSKAALAPVKGLDKAGAKALRQAVALAKAGADPLTMLAPLFGHANRVRGSVSDAINRGGNEGSTAVADALDLPTVWVAETDACVHCLRYSGVIAKPGKAFPGGLTYGKKSYYPDKIKTPPRHPRCRCTVEPLVDDSYAAALRREADRSVLRGFSLPSESMGVRVDAAKRLVDKGVEAPKTVIAFAERAVKKGAFPTRGRGQGHR